MSGGSFNYLYIKDARDWVEHYQDSATSDAGSMAEALVALDAPEIAQEIYLVQHRIRVMLASIEPVLKNLADVMHAVEWFQSCDWGREDVMTEIAKFRGDMCSDGKHIDGCVDPNFVGKRIDPDKLDIEWGRWCNLCGELVEAKP